MTKPTTQAMPPVAEAFAKIAELAEADGVKNAYAMFPGACWERKVDDRWWFALNPHNEPTACTHGSKKIEPFSVLLEYNGWPAGIISPFGGIIAAGDAANEATFIAALDAAIAAAKGRSP